MSHHEEIDAAIAIFGDDFIQGADLDSFDVRIPPFSLHVEIGGEYPAKLPLFRCYQDSKADISIDQARLYANFGDFCCQNDVVGRECLIECLEWFRANVLDLAEQAAKSSTKRPEKKEKNVWTRTFLRFHHIYATNKRKHCKHWAIEEGLTGRSRPGKPGIVYVEGPSDAVRAYVARLRGLNWQKMTVSATIDVEYVSEAPQRCFDDMDETGDAVVDWLPLFAGMEAFFYEGTGVVQR